MSEEKRIVLSHQDSGRLDEMITDQRAAKQVFMAAQSHYHNMCNSLDKTERELWRHFNETYTLDMSVEHSAKFDELERRFVIAEKADSHDK